MRHLSEQLYSCVTMCPLSCRLFMLWWLRTPLVTSSTKHPLARLREHARSLFQLVDVLLPSEHVVSSLSLSLSLFLFLPSTNKPIPNVDHATLAPGRGPALHRGCTRVCCAAMVVVDCSGAVGQVEPAHQNLCFRPLSFSGRGLVQCCLFDSSTDSRIKTI